MSSFHCDRCGRRIGVNDSHLLLTDNSVVCMRHYRLALDAGQIADVLTQREAVDRLHPSISGPRGPELRTARAVRGDGDK